MSPRNLEARPGSRSEPRFDLVRVMIEASEAGIRLDLVLAGRFPDKSRSVVQRWIKQGGVSRGDPKASMGRGAAPVAKAKTPVSAGECYWVRVPEERVFRLEAEALTLPLLHQDDDILVVVKPAGMVSHPSPGHSDGTLVNALLHASSQLSTVGGDERPGIVHRLDRDTSGVMVVAKTDFAHRGLSAQFKARTTKKVYLAIVRGRPRSDELAVDRPIGRSRHHRKKMACVPDGRAAQTRFLVLERFARHAYVRCFPRTGRTHQIRVHLHALSLPIACDSLYAAEGPLTATLLRTGRRGRKDEAPVLARHALHAFSLGFAHPRSGERMRFDAPLPADMEATLAVLREI